VGGGCLKSHWGGLRVFLVDVAGFCYFRFPESSEDWLPLAEARKPNASYVTRPSKVSQYRRPAPPVTRRLHSHEIDSSFRVYAQNSSESLVFHSNFSL
jgi:hypothetical protein